MDFANYVLYGVSISGLLFLLWLFVKNELTLAPVFLFKLYLKLNKIMATQAELAAQLTALTGQVTKIGTETQATLQKVQELQDALNNAGEVTPEVQAAFDALKASVQSVDDLVADAPTTEDTTE